MSNNGTLRSGYSTVDSQAEITGSGPFDLKHIQMRKNAASRGLREKTYPNPTNANLGVQPGEILVYRKANAGMTTKGGGQKLAVFSSLNGYCYGHYATLELAMRDLGFAGISKTLYTMPGESSTNGDYQTYSGIAWLESGSVSANRNTGTETIPAGSLVCLELPSPQPLMNARMLPKGTSHVSPNNPGNGMSSGKYVMVTKPFDPLDYSAQLKTYSALFYTSKDAQYNPGIMDMPFENLYKQGPRVKRNSDAQQAAGALWYGVFGIFFGVLEELREQGIDPSQNKTALMNAMGVTSVNRANKQLALNCINNVLLHSVHGNANRTLAINNFKTRNSNAFVGNSNELKDSSDSAVQYARMRLNAIPNLFGAQGDAAYQQNRWVIGRAMHTAFPGGTLDLVVGDHNRPLSK
jgi:hypothetical protein